MKRQLSHCYKWKEMRIGKCSIRCSFGLPFWFLFSDPAKILTFEGPKVLTFRPQRNVFSTCRENQENTWIYENLMDSFSTPDLMNLGPGNLQCSNVSSVNFNHFFVVSLKTSYFVENQPVWFNPVLYYNFGGQTPWVFFNRMGSVSLEPTGRTKCTAIPDASMPVGCCWRPAAGSTCRI